VSEKKNGKYLDELRKMGLVTFIEHLETPKREAETNCLWWACKRFFSCTGNWQVITMLFETFFFAFW
jgi:hypothetical protein